MMNKEMISRIARYCVTSGSQNTTDGRWSITYDELSHHFGVDKNDINGNAQLLADALNQQEEINDLMMTEDCIEMTYHMEHCPLCQQGGIEGAFALSSVLGCNITDEHEEHKYEPMPYDEVETKLARQILWLYAGEGEQQCFSRCEITGQSFIARDFPNLSFYNCRFNNVTALLKTAISLTATSHTSKPRARILRVRIFVNPQCATLGLTPAISREQR